MLPLKPRMPIGPLAPSFPSSPLGPGSPGVPLSPGRPTEIRKLWGLRLRTGRALSDHCLAQPSIFPLPLLLDFFSVKDAAKTEPKRPAQTFPVSTFNPASLDPSPRKVQVYCEQCQRCQSHLGEISLALPMLEI